MRRWFIATVSLGAAFAAPDAATAQDANAATLALVCDRAAGSLGDKSLPPGIIGVRIEKVDARVAVPACEAAAKAFPDQIRLVYQLGRAYDAMKAYDLAMTQYVKAYDQGYKRAAASIGGLYRDGRGVTRDYQEARRWLDRGAEVNDPLAMGGLGWLYMNGLGVPFDYQEARRWFERAADGGDPVAMGHTGWLHQQGLGVRIDYVEARRWYERGATAGDPFSMASLGRYFERGLGGPQGMADACLWYTKAAELGEPTSHESIRVLGCR